MFERNPSTCLPVEGKLRTNKALSPSELHHVHDCLSCQAFERAVEDAPKIKEAMLQVTERVIEEGTESDEHLHAALLLLGRAVELVNRLREMNPTMINRAVTRFLYAVEQVKTHEPEKTFEQLKHVPLLAALNTNQQNDDEAIRHYWKVKLPLV